MTWYHIRFKVVEVITARVITAEEALVCASNHSEAIAKLYDILSDGWEMEFNTTYELDWVDCRVFDGPVIQ